MVAHSENDVQKIKLQNVFHQKLKIKFPEIDKFEIFNFALCQKLLMGFSLNFEVAMKNLKRKK